MKEARSVLDAIKEDELADFDPGDSKRMKKLSENDSGPHEAF